MQTEASKVSLLVHSLADFKAWVAALGQAWIDRSPDAAAGLFPLTLDFYETPFSPPVQTREQIRELWLEVPKAHRNVEFRSEIIMFDTARRIGLAHWRAKFERAPSGKTAELDGIYKVVFSEGGDVLEFRQWFNSAASPPIDAAKEFVCQRFAQYPHFSFGDGRIMIDHTMKVYDLACRLSEETPCNRLVTGLCALLHDIGKTADLDPETLEREHEALGWTISQEFLSACALAPRDLGAIKDFFEGKPSPERDIVKDADILAFFFDTALQAAYVKWAALNGKASLIPKKWEKFKKLKLRKSEELGAEAWCLSREKWRTTFPADNK